MQLQDCLNNYPYRTLTVIARLWQIVGLRNVKKNKLIERLTESLLDVNALAKTLQQLSPDAINALQALINAGGTLPWLDFRQRFGDIRPYRPWDNEQKNNYDLTSASPAEQLAYLGLIYRHPRRPKPAQTQEIIIPSDLLPLLPSLKPATAATPIAQSSVTARRSPHFDIEDDVSLLFDLTTFLSFIHKQQPKALYNGRWLSPKNVENINQQLMQPDEISKPLRNEG